MTKYQVASDMVPFEGKDDVKLADRRVAELLKEIFRPYLPKVEYQQDADDDEDY